MRPTRKAALYASTGLFRFILFFGVTLVSLTIIITSKQHIKDTFVATGAYDNFVNSIVKDTAQANRNSTFPINNPDVQKIITSSFSPQLIKSSNETVIDGIYDWLEGKTNEPVFTVDLSGARQKAADEIAAYAFNRLGSLPSCFAIPETIDPFTAGCSPPYADFAAEQQKLSQQIAGPEGILPKATFSQKDLPKNTEGIIIYERYTKAPQIYDWLKYLPFIVVTVLLILATIVVVGSKTKRHGLQQLGMAIVGSSIALIVTPVIFNFVIPRFRGSLSFSTVTQSSQDIVNLVISQLTNDFYSNMINITLQLLTIGVVILIAEKLTRPVSQYSTVKKRAGIISSDRKKQTKPGKKYRPSDVPIQSSEESKRHRPKRTKNKKYRRIPKKEI